MSLRRGAMVGLISTCVCLALLFSFYPWSVYYGNFNYSAGVTLGAYIVVGLLVGLVGGIAVAGMSFFQLPAAAQGLLTGVFALTTIVLGSLAFGPYGLDPSYVRVRGIFFAEWKFVNFIFEIALPITLLDAGLAWLLSHRTRKAKT